MPPSRGLQTALQRAVPVAERDFIQPKGDVKTVLDLTDRDIQDDILFPTPADAKGENLISWFAAPERRTVHFTPQVQTFPYRGQAQFGGRISFEIDRVSAGDLIHMVALQVRLGHWLDEGVRAKLESGQIYYDLTNYPQDAWTYTNGIGRVLIESAEFVIDDTTIERVDTVAADCILKLFPDLNNVFGFGRDGVGYTNIAELVTPPSMNATTEATGMFDPKRPFTTENGDIFCLVPFFFTRHPYKGSFPLLSVTGAQNSKVRINFNLRPFEQCIRQSAGWRTDCNETPLDKTVHFKTYPGNEPYLVQTCRNPPAFQDVKMVVFSSLIDDDMRKKYIHKPYECIYRTLQPFIFAEPLKYAVAASNSTVDSIKVQLPLEFNHPIEEIFWIIRRKATNINNDWLNFGTYTEYQYRSNPNLIPFEPLIEGSIAINGIPIIQQSGKWFRHHIASLHRGGIVPYSSYIYGYSFARKPGMFSPSGTINASRTSSIRLDLTVRVPPSDSHSFNSAENQTWEVFVYATAINWLRFQNGMGAAIYNS